MQRGEDRGEEDRDRLGCADWNAQTGPGLGVQTGRDGSSRGTGISCEWRRAERERDWLGETVQDGAKRGTLGEREKKGLYQEHSPPYTV